MSHHRGIRSGQALYNVFIAPFAVRPLLRPSECAVVRPVLTQQTRNITRGKKIVQPATRKEKWNDEITARLIILKDPATGTLQPPASTWEVLSSLNLDLERLVQLVPDQPNDPNFKPICQIVNKKEAFDAARQRKQERKQVEKQKAIERNVKTIEINWAIDSNDLTLRLLRLRGFLFEGRKVEVILAPKKRGKRATIEEAGEIVDKVKKAVQEVNGAREPKPMEGKVGAVAMFFFQGPTQSTVGERAGVDQHRPSTSEHIAN